MAFITSESVFQLINNYLGNYVPNGTLDLMAVVADETYQTIADPEWIRTQALTDPILAPKKYKKEIFDCDDYVMYLKTRLSLLAANTSGMSSPFAFGFILTTTHAFNFGFTDDNYLFILNTQSDNRNMLIAQTSAQCGPFLNLSQSNLLKSIYI